MINRAGPEKEAGPELNWGNNSGNGRKLWKSLNFNEKSRILVVFFFVLFLMRKFDTGIYLCDLNGKFLEK